MTWTLLELFANLATVICIFLAGRNSVHTWWTGMVACVLFMWLFFDAKLYADVTLQIFFIVTSVIGWMAWAKVGINTLPITRLTQNQTLKWLAISLAGAGAYGLLLHTFTDAYAPFIDSMVLTFSMLGQLLLMARKREAWPVWIIVNILSVPLYFSRELYMTAGLYAVFLAHAIWVTPQWYKLEKV